MNTKETRAIETLTLLTQLRAREPDLYEAYMAIDISVPPKPAVADFNDDWWSSEQAKDLQADLNVLLSLGGSQ